MGEKRTTIRLNQHTLEVIDKAEKIWPEHDDNLSELIRQIIADWDRIRDDNGTGTRAQTVQRLNTIVGMLEIILEMLTNDTDHG